MNDTKKEVPFEGRIQATTSDGCFAVVLLNVEIDGVDQAVINNETVGRVHLMNGKGKLVVGQHVRGTGRKNSSAIRALSVEAAE